MAKGINISIASDTRDFQKGVKNGIIEPLEDAGEILEDLAKDGDRSGEKLERTLKDQQRESEELGDKYRELGDQIKASGKKGRDFGDDMKGGTHKAEEGMSEFKDEANSTAREAAASFDGSAESIGDAFQEVAANAFAGFGPAGVAAGLAVAGGLGIMFSTFTKINEDAAATREQVKGLVDELFEVEGNTKLLDYVTQLREFLDKPAAGDDMFSQISNFLDDQGTKFDQARRDAEKYGLSVSDLLRSYSGGDADAAIRTIEQLEDAQKDLYNSGRDHMGLRKKEAQSIQEVIDRIRDQNNLTDEAVAKYEAISKATAEMAAEQEAAAAKVEAVEDAVSALQDGLDDAVTGFQDFKDAEGNLDPAGYVKSISERIAATQNFNTNVQSIAAQFSLSHEEVQAILDQGVNFGPMLQSILDSGLAPEFVAQIQAAVGGGQDILAGANLGAEVGVDADTSKAKSAVDGLTSGDYKADVKVKAETKQADAQIQKVADKARRATIDVTADTAAAERALDRLASRTRRTTIIADVRTRDGKPVY